MNKLLASVLLVSAAACSTDPAAMPEPEPEPDPVSEPAPALPAITLKLAGSSARVIRNQTLSIPVTIKRNELANGPILVSVSDLPGGVNAPSITIPAGDSTGMLQLAAGTLIALGTEVTIRIEANADGVKDSAPLDLALTDAPGALDVTFGSGGLAARTFYTGSEGGVATVVQPDGKILVAARNTTGETYYLTRYEANGVVDTTFAGGSPLAFYATDTGEVRIALRADGSILFGLSTVNAVGPVTKIYAYTSSGSPVSGFGNTPTAAVLSSATIGQTFQFADMAVGADGSIYVGGSSQGDLAVAHFTAAGKLDAGFDGDGVAYVDLGGAEEASSLLLRSDGRLAIAGRSQNIYGSMALAQLTATGAPDGSLPNNGKLVVDNGSSSVFRVVRERPDGKLALFGVYSNYLTLSTVDTNGVMQGKTLSSQLSELARMMLPVDGGFLLAQDAGSVMRVQRVSFDGTIDTTFGSQGKVDVAMPQCIVGDGALDAQGRLVFATGCPLAAEKSVFGRAWL